MNFVGKDGTSHDADADRTDLNGRLSFETLGIADPQSFQFAGTRKERKRRAVEFDFGPGDLRADSLDALFDDGTEEVDARPNGHDEQNEENDDHSDDQLFHKSDACLNFCGNKSKPGPI